MVSLFHDTLIYEHMLGNMELGLKKLSKTYLGHRQVSFEELVANQTDITGADPEKLKEYSLQDSEVTVQIYDKQKTAWIKKSEQAFYDIEMPLVSVLANMEINGVVIDAKKLKSLEVTYEE